MNKYAYAKMMGLIKRAEETAEQIARKDLEKATKQREAQQVAKQKANTKKFESGFKKQYDAATANYEKQLQQEKRDAEAERKAKAQINDIGKQVAIGHYKEQLAKDPKYMTTQERNAFNRAQQKAQRQAAQLQAFLEQDERMQKQDQPTPQDLAAKANGDKMQSQWFAYQNEHAPAADKLYQVAQEDSRYKPLYNNFLNGQFTPQENTGFMRSANKYNAYQNSGFWHQLLEWLRYHWASLVGGNAEATERGQYLKSQKNVQDILNKYNK